MIRTVNSRGTDVPESSFDAVECGMGEQLENPRFTDMTLSISMNSRSSWVCSSDNRRLLLFDAWKRDHGCL